MTVKEFRKGWLHFLDCIDFSKTNLDADAIRFMNEAPAEIAKALKEKEGKT